MKAYVVNQATGATYGQGVTDRNGSFTLVWTAPVQTFNGQVWLALEHKDGRFNIRLADGGRLAYTPGFVGVAGQTANIGARTVGSVAVPDYYANLYDGARKMWNNSLSQTNRMTAYFNNVEIRGFTTSRCRTSCTFGDENRIFISFATDAYSPQGRVMHEMGHVASYVASRDQSSHEYPAGVYDRGGNSGWNLASAEYAGVHFEEGVATHLADVALYFPDAVAPHTCLSSSSCPDNSFNIETSLGANCANEGNRQVINAVRYFWDNYDSRVDYTNENLSMGVWHAVDTIHAFDNGYNDRQKDEMWNSTYTAADDYDGRSAIDFRENWDTWGTDSAVQLSNNCGSAGD